jgi:hypothetical protein
MGIISDIFDGGPHAIAYMIMVIGVSGGWMFSLYVIGIADNCLSAVLRAIKKTTKDEDGHYEFPFMIQLAAALEGYGFAIIMLIRIIITIVFVYYLFSEVGVDVETWIYSIFTLGIAAFSFQLPLQQIVCGFTNGLNSSTFSGKYLNIQGKLCKIRNLSMTNVILENVDYRASRSSKSTCLIHIPHTVFLSSVISVYDKKEDMQKAYATSINAGVPIKNPQRPQGSLIL